MSTSTASTETAARRDPEDQRRTRNRAVRVNVERFALLGAWALVIIVFGILEPDTFLTWSNFSGMFGSQAVLVVLTCALLIPLTAGDYDLSVTGTLQLSQMMIGVLNAQHHWSLAVVLPLCLVTGAVVGLVNSVFAVRLGVDSFIVTLGMGTLLSGLVLLIGNSTTISGIDQALLDWIAVKRLFGIPLEFYYGVALVLALWYVAMYTALGRRMLFVGQNRSVSRLSGLRVGHLRTLAFVSAGVVAAFAGILYAGTTGAADPTSGASFLLPAFAAAFLGATTIFPGRFNPIGSFIAVYFLVTGITGLTLMGAQSWVQNVFYGGALVIAVTLSQLARGRVGRT
jgi:ribose transport system permease protein